MHVSISPHTTAGCVDFANIVAMSHFDEVAPMASKFLGDDDLMVCAVKNHKITCASRMIAFKLHNIQPKEH